ncbi:hypothetical protein L596_011689 [Steinernema carpocapsae]|uniref:RAVE complex protein Rav1 C-terminal domain-containing protein n=1 Tax=Steinernema carpocapsae TaxID=34508 RepID=A0A4U5NUR5_STECR|nr:hypothetical protein L596_011689 [Steinernema carpocapsae]
MTSPSSAAEYRPPEEIRRPKRRTEKKKGKNSEDEAAKGESRRPQSVFHDCVCVRPFCDHICIICISFQVNFSLAPSTAVDAPIPAIRANRSGTMSAHQVITGALNKGESVFAVGTVEGINFTACAVGTDVVILASNFERVQVIPGGLRDDETVVTSVNCCSDSGKIAATYGRSIRIFDPVHHSGNKFRHKLNYRWFESCNILFEDKPVSSVQWSLEGMRLLISSGNELLLYQNKALSRIGHNQGVVFSISEDKVQNDVWECVWRTVLSEEARFIRFSPDSTLFATCGENDLLVKIWYQDNEGNEHNQRTNFKHCYLQHPCPITGFEWRKTGRYMPRNCIQNVLITWCVDNTSRIWKENCQFDNAFDVNGDIIEIAEVEEHHHKKHKHFRVKNARKKILNRLSKLKHDSKKKKHSECNSGAFYASGSRSPSCWDLASNNSGGFNAVDFYLACTINADNDCLLVPSMDTNNSLQKKPLTVHWLNNKELIFSKGAEKLLAEALLNETLSERGTSEDANSECTSVEIDVPVKTPSTINGTPEVTTPVNADQISMTTNDALDVKLESLLRQWTKSSDILFAIHPVDGSLLSWTTEWLDDNCRQPTVSFTSRFPSAFPLTDASSLNPLLNTFNPHDPIYVDVLQRHHDHASSSESTEGTEQEKTDHNNIHNAISRKIQNNTLLMLTSHENGSLNLWRLSMEENSNFTTILNVTHKSRMCGHRFQVNKVVPHPVLPLLITSSQFSSELCASVNNNADMVKESELILWKISPVGPLCRSGGVRELARITSNAAEAFSCLAWIPAILPSSTLGSVCNSPSSCFVASNGGKLIVYQAVVDARGLLSELFSAKATRTRSSSFSSVGEAPQSNNYHRLNDTFNVVSSQSTARPGCVLRLSDISNSDHKWDGVLLLHIFNERLAISNGDVDLDASAVRGSVIDRSKATTFSDRYFLVMIEKDSNVDRLRMWSVNLSSQIPMLIDHEDGNGSGRNIGYYRSASPMRPSAAKLVMDSALLCDCELGLPEGVRALSAVATAGHLPSSSLYPACQAPYVIMVACSDEHIRFYKCVKKDAGETCTYAWEEWRMISDDIPSALEMDGSICNVSAAHSGRFACAFKAPGSEMSNKIEVAVFECESSGGVEWLREDTLKITGASVLCSKYAKCDINDYYDVKHPVDNFVCEISQRDPSHRASLLKRIPSRSKFGSDCSLNLRRVLSDHQLICAHLIERRKANPNVWLDWVSTEDGSHILTVGVGTYIYIYTQVSQDTAQRNVVMMKDTHDVRRPQLRKASSLVNSEDLRARLVRWQCIRVLELDSADGLPPFPTTMTWVRDGLLLVGVHSEMRVYNQWSLSTRISAPPKPEKEKISKLAPATIASSLALNLSRSHSMLDQLSKRPKFDHSSGTKMIKEIMNRVMSTKDLQEMVNYDDVVEAVSDEGLFEAARLASPILPQYHPKQLIEMLNSGKTRRVKAILLHVLRVLKRKNTSGTNVLNRGASVRKLSSVGLGDGSPGNPRELQRSLSITIEEGPDYEELDVLSPLPLYLLFEADDTDGSSDDPKRMNSQDANYDSLFSANVIEDLPDDLLEEEEERSSMGGRSRANSCSSNVFRSNYNISTAFSERNNRMLTELLTHTHLPGLTSVDQMHLLAIADTLSHFSSDVMDKLTQANAALKAPNVSILNDNSSSGYAQSGASTDSVDECGLRFLMAMKQHEYLLLCLPPNQRKRLGDKGLHSAHIIWAMHSEAENELLNAIPCLQKGSPTWPELRSLGFVWWLKNTTSLKTCVEKMAKAAFQQDSNPMDASLYYLALKKKNVLTHLFKSVQDSKMADFFQQDFTQDFWRKAALKNAFVLMGKQRYQHAAGFFLLGGSLKDALQAIMSKLDDIQLAMMVIRLYESEVTKQNALLKDLLCRDVLGISVDDFDVGNVVIGSSTELNHSDGRQRNPFERSMAFWLLKDYTRAASTLLEEASKDRFESSDLNDCSLSDIFNFYTYLRKHPLVVRQKLNDAGVQVGTTDAFLALGKELENQVTPSERRLFFRTASAHLAKGCPLLALDVLQRLPKNLNIATTLSLRSLKTRQQALDSIDQVDKPAFDKANTVDATDWSVPTNVVRDDDLELKWSDDEDEAEEEPIPEVKIEAVDEPKLVTQIEADDTLNDSTDLEIKKTYIDIIAQQLKFSACLRILMDEMSMLASGFEVDGGQLRSELFQWLEREVVLLKKVCDYHIETSVTGEDDSGLEILDFNDGSEINQLLPLHEALQRDRLNLSAKAKATIRRRRWLIANQKLIRSFTSYCALHSAQNYRLTSALMELLILLLEVQQDSGLEVEKLSNDPIPDIQSFPLLVASLSSFKMFVPSPLHFIENQCGDLLYSILDVVEPPVIEQSLVKAYSLYHLCQGLSSCVYQALSDIDHCCNSENCQHSGALTVRRMRTLSNAASAHEDINVCSVPSKWPGVDNLVALLSREHDEDSPNLRLLLTECFVSISMSLFCYAFTACDARWLYRLAAHDMNTASFGDVFGGGGEKKLKTAAPARPPRPARPSSTVSTVSQNTVASKSDSATLRARLHAKVFGTDLNSHSPSASYVASGNSSPSLASTPAAVEQTISCWIPPNKHIVQYFAQKPHHGKDLGVEYDSDDSLSDADDESDSGDLDLEPPAHNSPNSYPWLLMRLACVHMQLFRLSHFLSLAGFDSGDLPSLSPRITSIIRLLENWVACLENQLDTYPGGCPVSLLSDMSVDTSDPLSVGLLKKYRVLIEPGNTPFESDDNNALPVRRLWAYLVRQEHLMEIFVRFIFGQRTTSIHDHTTRSQGSSADSGRLPDPYKIVHREQEPIVAFACGHSRNGWIVLSTGREIQELDISSVYDEKENLVRKKSSWLQSRAELDIALEKMSKDPLRDNDDYQLITDAGRAPVPGNHFMTPFVVDRSRKALRKMVKRPVTGVRRLDAHPTLPYYLGGSSDGSIKLWEWGSQQPLFTARGAGQYAKVTKVVFSTNGNKFAAVDGDGLLCLWQASQSLTVRKPFFNQKCHQKTAADVKFLGQTSSVLVTAGHGTGDINVALWDTLLPQSKAMVHSWVTHTDGATSLHYLPHSQTIISGGRHGEINIWDVRQRQLRASIKAFEGTSVKSLAADPAGDLIIAGSNDGDIKIWSGGDVVPSLLYALPGEHATKGGFSLRQVGSSNLQGVQQLLVDHQMRLFSCGADCSLKFRTLPNIFNSHWI